MGNVSGVKAKTFGQGATTSNVNVAALATPTTAFTLIGQLPVTPANNNVAVLNITSAGNVSTVNFTITGVNSLGVAATEVISGPNATTKPSVTVWQSISSVEVSAQPGTNTSLGFGASTGTGVVFAGRTRVRGFSGISLAATAGTVVISDAAISTNVTAPAISTASTSLLQIPTAALLTDIDPYIPDDGVLFPNGAYINTNGGTQAITVYFDG